MLPQPLTFIAFAASAFLLLVLTAERLGLGGMASILAFLPVGFAAILIIGPSVGAPDESAGAALLDVHLVPGLAGLLVGGLVGYVVRTAVIDKSR